MRLLEGRRLNYWPFLASCSSGAHHLSHKEPYAELHDRPIQLVYVAVERDEDLISTIKMYGQSSQLDERPHHECFADVLKKLPDGCLAVPLEDGATRKTIADKYKAGIFTLAFFGADGSQHSSRAALLLLKRRDDVISSKDSKKVKVATLEGKIVALYFSAHWKHLSNWLKWKDSTLIILDKQGKTLHTEGMELVYKYGIEAYPFTKERVEELKHAEEAKRFSNLGKPSCDR
ncbi:hypothetical protein L7F22_056548 [Adiantum nelumboides]|nr:hypothetical protein [Adiantum nelumboides]